MATLAFYHNIAVGWSYPVGVVKTRAANESESGRWGVSFKCLFLMFHYTIVSGRCTVGLKLLSDLRDWLWANSIHCPSSSMASSLATFAAQVGHLERNCCAIKIFFFFVVNIGCRSCGSVRVLTAVSVMLWPFYGTFSEHGNLRKLRTDILTTTLLELCR